MTLVPQTKNQAKNAMDGFGARDTLNVDIWCPDEVMFLMHSAQSHGDVKAEIAYRSAMTMLDHICGGEDSVSCVCCDEHVQSLDDLKFTVVWSGKGEKELDQGRPGTKLTAATAAMVICSDCVAKGVDHIHETAIKALWEAWPTALAIRLRHDRDAARMRKEAAKAAEATSGKGGRS